ncbi:glycosyl hydrolase family 28-related protein [Bacillus cereus]|nr:glycosyl hydrolase family 28-related protein [Bacillus cereus]
MHLIPNQNGFDRNNRILEIENKRNTMRVVNGQIEFIEENIDKQNERIDNLVINASGDSNAEVVDARVSKLSTTFPLLKNHLDFLEEELMRRALNVQWFGAKLDGETDDTDRIQAAIEYAVRNGYNVVFIPPGKVLTGSLLIPNDFVLRGAGSNLTKLILKKESGYQSFKYPSVIRNQSMPIYWESSNKDKAIEQGIARNISISGMEIDCKNEDKYYGLHFISTDNIVVKDVIIRNCFGAMDFRAIRNGYVRDCLIEDVMTDGYSISGENFNPMTDGKKWSTEGFVFENCIARRCGLSNSPNPPDGNAFELDDGAIDVKYINCLAEHNFGSGFDLHIHDNIYDLRDITFENCTARFNKHAPGTERSVAGFHLGMCPEGSFFGNINFDNCRAYGNESQQLSNYPGSGKDDKVNVTINNCYFESKYYASDRGREDNRNMTNAVIALRGRFKNWKISNTTIVGSDGLYDGYGIYSYGIGCELSITDITLKDVYVPFYFRQTEGQRGYLKARNVIAYACNPINTKALESKAFMVSGGIAVYDDVTVVVSADNYTSYPFRILQTEVAKITNSTFTNTSAKKAQGALQFQDCGSVFVHGNVAEGFDYGVYLSNDKFNLVSISNNDFLKCTEVVNQPTYVFLQAHHNVSVSLPVNPGWVPLTLAEGWSTQSNRVLRYRLEDDGGLRISGAVGGGTLGSTIGYIPQKFAPKRNATILCESAFVGRSVIVNVATDGAISIPTINNDPATNLNFISIEFSYSRL